MRTMELGIRTLGVSWNGKLVPVKVEEGSPPTSVKCFNWSQPYGALKATSEESVEAIRGGSIA